MYNWKRWLWPGALTIILMSALALWTKAGFIEQDLQQRVETALKTADLEWVGVTMSGRDATLTGQAPSKEARAQSENIAGQIADIRTVEDRSGLIALQTPYLFVVERKGDTVAVIGFAPSRVLRRDILKIAETALPGFNVRDETQLARGAPENFLALVRFGIDRLEQLQNGKVSWSDTKLSVSGTAVDHGAYDAITTALAESLPDGVELAENSVVPPVVTPFSWSAEYDGNQLKLSGFVPSAASRNVLVNQATKIVRSGNIVDNQLLASGSADEFQEDALFALSQLARFSNGTVSLYDRNLTATGVAEDTSAYLAVLEALSDDVPKGLRIADQQVSPPVVSPYRWALDYEGASLVLTGFVPGNAVRENVLGVIAQQLPNASIDDKTQIAAGAPPSFFPAVKFVVGQLPHLKNAGATLTGSDLQLAGGARDTAGYKAVRANLTGNLPATINLIAGDIRPPSASPYVWSASTEGKILKLNGFVPSEAVRKTFVERAKAEFSGQPIVDLMEIAVGAPTGFATAVEFALSQLSGLKAGSVSLSDTTLSIKGEAVEPQSYATMRDGLKTSLPDGFKLGELALTPPIVAPYTWSAKQSAQGFVLSGHTPDDQTRLEIIDLAKSLTGGAGVVDEMLIARGAPQSFASIAQKALKLVSHLSEGEINLSDSGLTVTGIARSPSDYEDIRANVASGLFPGVTLRSADIRPSAAKGVYRWQATLRNGAIVLEGSAPSIETRIQIEEQTRQIHPDQTVENRLLVETGAPQGFLEALTGLAGALRYTSDGVVSLRDNALAISGTAKTVADYETLLTEISKAPESYRWESRDITPATVSPYSWRATDTGTFLKLEGFVPNEEVADRLKQAAGKRSKANVEATQRVAEGAPVGFEQAILTSLAVFERLDVARVSLSGTRLTVEGRAPSEAESNEIADELERQLRSGFQLRRLIAYPPPEVEPKQVPKPKPEPTAALKPEPDTLTLTQPRKAGVSNSKPVQKETPVPASKPDEVAKLESKAGAEQPQDEEVPAPSSNEQAVAKPGPKAVEPAAVPVKPATPEQTDKSEEPDKAEPVKIATAEPDPVPEPVPETCKVDFQSLFEGEKIQFRTSRAVIADESRALLTRIATGAKQCSGARIEVGGHTDSRGSRRYNLALSKARASAVVKYLTRSGVPKERLVAKGYGESSPIASNRQAETRARNRRIEFKVISLQQ